MTTTTAPQPVLRETPSGWLALTAGADYPRIGVVADTAEHAREQWEVSRDQWLALREAPELSTRDRQARGA